MISSASVKQKPSYTSSWINKEAIIDYYSRIHCNSVILKVMHIATTAKSECACDNTQISKTQYGTFWSVSKKRSMNIRMSCPNTDMELTVSILYIYMYDEIMCFV